MEKNDLKNSVPLEQFSNKAEDTDGDDIKSNSPEDNKETLDTQSGGNKNEANSEELQDLQSIDKDDVKEGSGEKLEKEEKKEETEESNKDSGENQVKGKKKEDKIELKEADKDKDKSPTKEETIENASLKDDKEKPDKKIEESAVPIEEEKKEINQQEPEEIIDYTKLSKSDLIKVLKEIIENKPVGSIKTDIDSIKVNFYKKYRNEIEQIKANFLKEGGNIEDFKPQDEPLENELKELLNKYKSLKSDYNKHLEGQKEENLKEKYEIINEIKDLVNRKESINKTFQEFRDLQKKWREIGLVPQNKVKDLWETYHHHVEKFYDFIKINKELRDIDLKKNLELKIILCEKAEDLLLEPSVLKSFEELQKLHEQWREIGPVSRELKDSTWERFKAATTTINKKYQAYFEDLKKSQKKNLEAKTMLCEKVEEILTQELQNHKDWEDRSNEVKELQKVWKTIGFAPKKYNTSIYQRFRSACDQFFAGKREFYAENKEIQNTNLQIKLELCAHAEALKDSKDWKKTTEELIQLQIKWKKVGPVSKKQSDEVWKRFRSACDHFFNCKKEFFSNIDSEYDNNLKLKEDIIKEISEFKLLDDVKENIKILKEYQRKWAEIGFVPFKDKERIQNEYREAINKHFDSLEIDETKRRILKFKNKIETIRQSPKYEQRLRSEREKFITKLKKLENNIVLWENNIGFFTKSKNANSMIEDVERKIKDAKEEMTLLEQKINIIDSYD